MATGLTLAYNSNGPNGWVGLTDFCEIARRRRCAPPLGPHTPRDTKPCEGDGWPTSAAYYAKLNSWDLQPPSIGIDPRWGVPRYSLKTPSNVDSVSVSAGDNIYFRIGSVFDGKCDQVAWDPVISYQNVTPTTDVNGLAAYAYQTSKDFTLAGRRDISVQKLFDGTVRLTGKLRESDTTTDNVSLLVLKNGVVVFSDDLAWNQTGDFNLPSDFIVAHDDVVKLRVSRLAHRREQAAVESGSVLHRRDRPGGPASEHQGAGFAQQLHHPTQSAI
jgi:hypothetical protein